MTAQGNAIEVSKPGVQYYADRIRSGIPFSFVRYGEGVFRMTVPSPKMGMSARQKASLARPGLVGEFTEMLTHAWRDENYVVGLLDVHSFNKWSTYYANRVSGWIRTNMPDLDWHASGVWARALLDGTLYPVVEAIREQPLPLVLVGPECIAGIGELARWDVRRHIVTDFTDAWEDRHALLRQMADVREPAFFMLSAGATAKILIYRAWPWIGRRSFMIDFGSTWNAFTTPCRKFHTRKLSRETLDRCLGMEVE